MKITKTDIAKSVKMEAVRIASEAWVVDDLILAKQRALELVKTVPSEIRKSVRKRVMAQNWKILRDANLQRPGILDKCVDE